MGKKASDEDKCSVAESYIHFQIEMKHNEIQDFQDEIAQLEAKQLKYTELCNQLKEEQMGHIKMLRKHAKEQERKLEQREVVNKEQVELALQQHLEMVRCQEAEIAELQLELRGLGERVLELKAVRHILLEYKNVGSQEDHKQIKHLEKELSQMQKGFHEMSGNIKRSLNVTFNEIDKKTVQLIDDKKQLATERAIKHLDKHSRQEIKENDWLKRELAIYKKEVSITVVAVHSLEEENLEHMNQLFKQRLDQLNISRNVFLTQVAGLGPSDSTMQDKYFRSIAADAGETSSSSKSLENEERDGSQTKLQEDEEKEEDLHLGPLEQKLLSVVGQAVPLHTLPPEDPDSFAAPEDWPLTANIIHKRFQT